ncbi:hypothetical protein EV129_112105 [Rhizobium azibense]|uniref:Uncharacterized protein n=1 Tax=Rhizobium azibense TaxID=1136135 RepID=A0A4R3RJ69_9HYPH|nr:hypothetical protein EV129_112105 [Rhizobium azibense]
MGAPVQIGQGSTLTIYLLLFPGCLTKQLTPPVRRRLPAKNLLSRSHLINDGGRYLEKLLVLRLRSVRSGQPAAPRCLVASNESSTHMLQVSASACWRTVRHRHPWADPRPFDGNDATGKLSMRKRATHRCFALAELDWWLPNSGDGRLVRLPFALPDRHLRNISPVSSFGVYHPK